MKLSPLFFFFFYYKTRISFYVDTSHTCAQGKSGSDLWAIWQIANWGEDKNHVVPNPNAYTNSESWKAYPPRLSVNFDKFWGTMHFCYHLSGLIQGIWVVVSSKLNLDCVLLTVCYLFCLHSACEREVPHVGEK